MKTNKLLSILLFALVAGLTSCTTPKEDPEAAAAKDRAAMLAKNKIAAQKIFDSFNTGNGDSLGNYMSDSYIEHQPLDPEIKTKGIQGFKDITTYFRTAFPDLKITTTSIVAEGDLVVVIYQTKATNSGPMGAMPATNKTVDFNGNDIFKFSDGKVVEHWGYYEEAKMMTQLGLLGEPKTDAKKK